MGLVTVTQHVDESTPGAYQRCLAEVMARPVGKFSRDDRWFGPNVDIPVLASINLPSARSGMLDVAEEGLEFLVIPLLACRLWDANDRPLHRARSLGITGKGT